MKFTADHEALRATVRKFIDREINPYVDSWEEATPRVGREQEGVAEGADHGG